MVTVEIITFDADPNRSGFGARVHSLIRMFSQVADVRVVLTDWFEGPQLPGVTYVAEPVQDSTRSRFRRLRTYYKTDFPEREPIDPPDLTIVESLDLLGLHQWGDAVPMILDEHNVYWELLWYEMVNTPFFKTWIGRRALVRRYLVPRLQERAKAFEVAALRRATRTLVTSERDRLLLIQELPELQDRIHVLPNCLDLDRIPVAAEPPEGNDVVFLGNYNYIPNQEAAFFVSRSLAPGLPEARFLLVGSNPPAASRVGENVVATGYVEDLPSVLGPAAVCIAPLTQGSGTRLKILTYLAAGKAVVATTKASEGLAVEDGEHLLIRDDPEDFRSGIQEILEDGDLRERLGRQGRALVESTYDWRVYVDQVSELSEGILSESALS